MGDFELSEILQKHENYMMSVAGRYLGWDKSDMDDVVQESRIAICRSISTFVGDNENLKKWIGGIVCNQCLTYIRKAKRRTKHEQEVGNKMPKSYNSDNKDITEDIKDVFNKLSEVEKFIVKRHYYDGQSYENIAKELNQNVGNIRSKIFRKFHKIRNNNKIS